jgi:hypothetical protein
MLKVAEVNSMDTDPELKKKGDPLDLRRNPMPDTSFGECHCLIHCPNEEQRTDLATFAKEHDCAEPVRRDDRPSAV